MSRYLTPGKIALLCLVELYAESRFPNQSILPVLSFVLKHIVSPKEASGFIVTLDQIKAATVNEPSAVVGRTIFDLLLKKLWEINSLDALHSFFTNLETFLIDMDGANKSAAVRVHGEKSPLSKTSVLGCFVRRAALEHTRMAFTDSIMLWKSFILYREPTLLLWKKRNLGAGPLSFDMNLKGLTLEDALFEHVYGRLKDGRECHISTDDVERLLEFQVDAMQRMGTRVPIVVQEQLQMMLRLNVTTPSLSHYVEFLNSWRAGDYTGAFDNLHRYFDYTMQNRDRTFYQYALLNLAILQADFGCYRESVLAMQETINTARENKDIACLNFSLSWFYHFHKAHPQDCPEVISSRMERESLQFLKAKAKEAGMHHLQSMAHLSEAKQLLIGGESIPAAFESIVRSSHLNVTKNIHNAMGSQILLQSATWGRLGVSYLSWMNCELFLAKYKKNSPVEDVVKALCRGAYIKSMRGRFDEALELLEEVEQESLRTLKMYQYWSAYIGLLKLRRAIHSGDILSADMLHEQLAASSFVEPDCALEIAFSKIDLQIRRGNFSAALGSISSLADELVRDKADLYHRIRLMTLRAQVLAKCGRAPKALSLVMRSAAISWRARILPMLFQSLQLLAAILTQLSEFETAYDIMDRIMPQVLECEDAAFNAQCFSVLADSLVGLAGQKGRKGNEAMGKVSGAVASAEVGIESKREELLHRGLEFIDRASVEFARVGDVAGRKVMLAKKARIMDFLGDRSVRDNTVKLYGELKASG